MNIQRLILTAFSAVFLLGFSACSFSSEEKVIEEREKTSQKMEDPLLEIFSQIKQEEGENSSLKADFLNSDGIVKEYTGDVSGTLQSCIDGIPDQEYGEEVLADFAHVPDMTQDEILEELNPVFGHAVRNGQINWIWDGENLSYQFLTAPGDERLWYCYMTDQNNPNETVFFSEFLDNVRIGESSNNCTFGPDFFGCIL